MADLTEEELELLDPHPNIHALFVHYNELYFDSSLGACSVEWSSARMTLCGGTCEFAPGGGCRIKLSEPLLKLRPTWELKQVLLHEMIHAHMMLGGIRDDEPSGHGTIFKSVMRRINTSTLPDSQRPSAGYNIDTHHEMHAEVDHYRQHHWKCKRCGSMIKRAMNRPPQEADCRGRVGRGSACRDPRCAYHQHIKACGGEWDKVHEPEGYGQKKGKKAAPVSSSGQQPPAKRVKKGAGGTRDITQFFKPAGAAGAAAAAAAAAGAGGCATGEEADAAGGEQAGAAGAGHPHQPADEGAPAIHPSLQAIASLAGQQQQQQQQQAVERKAPEAAPAAAPPAEHCAAERRQLLAEAALRRLRVQSAEPSALSGQPPSSPSQQAPHRAPQQQQRAQQPQQGQQLVNASEVEVEDLTCSPLEAVPSSVPGGHNAAYSQEQRLRQPACDVDAEDLTCSPPETHGTSAAAGPAAPSTAAPAARAAAGLECPVCGQRWGAAELSNADLNAHIDECLTLGYLQTGQGVG